MLFHVTVVCDKSPWFSIVKTVRDRVDRIRVIIIGRKAGARFWDCDDLQVTPAAGTDRCVPVGVTVQDNVRTRC